MQEHLTLNTVHYGYAEHLMLKIEPETIACSIWSPPYHLNKSYEKDQTFQDWRAMLRDVIHLHFPVLKKGGFMVVNIADILCFSDETMPKVQMPNPSKHKVTLSRDEILAVKEQYPTMSRYQLAEYFGCSEQTIDRRLNGNNIRGGKYLTQTRVELVGGYVQQYAEESGLYLYDRRIWKKDPAWHNSKWASNSYRAVDEFEYLYIFWKAGETVINKEKLTSKEWSEWGSRAVWDFPSVRANNEHEAMFPIELPRRCIKLFTEKDDIVLDPFMGSGTTALASVKLGRNFIGIEKEYKYVELAKSKIEAHSQKITLPFYEQ